MILRNQLALAILVLVSPVLLCAQTPLGEQLGGSTTRFTIITDSLVILNDSEQLLIKRGVREFDRDINGAYGYGYESYHLEFVADQAIEIVESNTNRRNRRLRARFYDAERQIMVQLFFEAAAVTTVPVAGLPVIYSIDLRGVPLPLLERTATIDLVWVE